MGFIDYLIVVIPVMFVLAAAWYTRRYVKGVADFLAAGRVAGRYIISVADLANGLAIISLVAYVEEHYRTGFSLAFWNNILMPLGLFLGMTGYCTYRFRETRALSIGQFLEMRYSKNFRIFAAALRSLTEVCSNMIMPAIAARFFIYFLDLPHTVNIFGFEISTFILVVFIVLTLAISIIWMGGTLALLVTDSLQGMLCYPLLFLFVVFVLYKFSWSTEIVEVMKDRVPGESFINPYDLSNFRDFNLFSLCVAVFVSVFHRASWLGAGNSSAARSPHEQKMAGVLGGWRSALTTMFYVLIAVCVITILNHRNYSKDAKVIRSEVASRIAGELVQDNAKRENLIRKIEALPEQKHRIGVDAPMGERHNQDTPYLNVAKTELQGTPEGNAKFQQFRTLFHQMTMAGTMRHILPPVMVGLFCLLMVLAMVSTDDTRIFSASLTISQDVVLPLIKKPLSPERHLLMIKLVSVGVGLIFLCGSFFMAQLDYIKLFVTVVGSMWMGGCGPVMVFGLYSRFGTAAGAWTSLVSGMVLSFSSILIQRNWADHVYPFLEKMGWVDGVGNFLSAVSKPFNPYIVWEMNAVKCPINSYEFYFITMIVSLILYVTVSYLTCREPFNLDKMLHRGAYHIEGQGAVKEKITWKSFWGKIIGITGEYSKGDKVIAWAVFFYCFVYGFGGTFLAVLIWNFFAPWKIEWWGNYFLVVFLVVPGIISLITTFWFGIGSLIDMRRLFTDLRKHAENPQDNGQVQK